MPRRPVLREAPRDERVELLRLLHGDVEDAEDLGGRERDAAGLLHDAELALRVERDAEHAGCEALLEKGRVEHRLRRRVREVREGETVRGVV